MLAIFVLTICHDYTFNQASHSQSHRFTYVKFLYVEVKAIHSYVACDFYDQLYEYIYVSW